MPRVTRPPTRPSLGQPRDVQRRPSRLKLLLRRQRRLLRPALWGVAGFGAVLAVVLLVHAARPGGALTRLGDVLAAAANLRVQHVVVEGRSNTPEPLLNAAIGVRRGESMLAFSLESTRQRIEALSWVEHAAVERRLPGTLVINLVERRPVAIWQNQGRFVLIDRDGQTVTGEDLAAFGDLPLVVGAGAPAAATTLLDALAAQPSIKPRVAAAVRVGERRWNLRLKNGTDVLLPEGADAAALAKLAELQAADTLLDRPLAVVDMRLPDRLVVRPAAPAAPAPSPAAAASPGKKA